MGIENMTAEQKREAQGKAVEARRPKSILSVSMPQSLARIGVTQADIGVWLNKVPDMFRNRAMKGPAFNPRAPLRKKVTEEEWNRLTINQRKNLYLRNHEKVCACGKVTGHHSGSCIRCRRHNSKDKPKQMSNDEIMYGF